MQCIIPQAVSQNIARAKSLLKREDPLRALEALITGLDLYEPAKLMGKARFEAEVLIQECVMELDRQPKIRSLLETLTKSNKASIAYKPGEEAKLKAMLPILRKALLENEQVKLTSAQETRTARKTMLEEKGLAYLKQGDTPRGKAALRVLADEFGQEAGVLAQIGLWLLEAKLYFEAAEFLEQSIESFPKESKAYGAATNCYLTLREFEKAEGIYLKAITQFGKHPKTLINLAKLYLEWNKKDKAFEAAQNALSLDPDNEEAKLIVEKYA